MHERNRGPEVVKAARSPAPDSCIDSLTLHIYAVVPSAWCYRPYIPLHPICQSYPSLHGGCQAACLLLPSSAQDRGLLPVLRAFLVPGSSECESRAAAPHPSMLRDYIASQA